MTLAQYRNRYFTIELSSFEVVCFGGIGQAKCSLYLWTCFCSTCLFVLCFRFHMQVKYGICLSLFDIFHSTQYPLGPSCCCRWQDFILFLKKWHVISHCIYTLLLLYPFTYWQTRKLLPYCKHCCNEHMDSYIFSI